ncbi:flippase [Halospina sp. K52047b]|uniref:flippase n=1 Tax=Halospina sp. K52047b TaxID=2614160 RepID=UPI00124A0BD6|nr:flippase [Halospina sp. K52047b]KAA8978333.1 flippase [Halospina sp. K52047b]
MNSVTARLSQFTSGSQLRRNITLTFGRQLLAAAAQLLLVVLIARKLGPEGNGHYAMAILIPTLLTNFLNFGVGPATVYYIGRGEFTPRQAARENFRMALIVAVIGATSTLPVLWLWSEQLLPNVPLPLLLIGLAAFPPSLLLSYSRSILQGLENFRAFNATILAPPYITLFGVLISLYALNAGTIGTVTAYLIGQTTGCLIVTMLLVRHLKNVNSQNESYSGKEYRRKTINYGWKAHLSNILAFVNYRADIFLVNFFLTPASTGLYVISVQIAERLWMLSQATSTVLLPRLSAMHGEPEARLSLTRKGFFLVSTITGAGCLVAALVLYWSIGPVFGSEYVDALPAFFCLLPGIIAGAGARVQANCIAAAGKPEWNTITAIIVVGANVIGNIILVPNYGIIGAAWATSIAYTGNAAVKHILVAKTRTIN